jgi:predicted dehydrogenase
MGKKLKLGIIGLSEGNGHPYSWSAIFNGYDTDQMRSCPFTVILKYLEKQNYPEDFLSHRASVTHILTQNRELSEHISACSRIPFICDTLDQMLGKVDAVLLARDDAENHAKYVLPVLEASLPIYIDKPFALSLANAKAIWNKVRFENQIFTCSALQFAKEFQYEKLNLNKIGDPKIIWATTPKSWEKYAVHLIEPILNLIPRRGNLNSVQSFSQSDDNMTNILITWDSGVKAYVQTTGNLPSPLWLRVLGDQGYQDLYFVDTFYAFRTALERFIDIIQGIKPSIPKAFTEEMVQILEEGRNA